MRYKFRACEPELAVKIAGEQYEKQNGAEGKSVIILRPDHDHDQVILYAPTRPVLLEYIEMYKAQDKAMGPAINEKENFIAWDQQDFKGVRFYAEYKDVTTKRKDVAHSPKRGLATLQLALTVVAIWYDQGKHGRYPGVVSVYDRPNCDSFSFTEISQKYLAEKCKSISKQQAMLIHPELFLSDYFNVD